MPARTMNSKAARTKWRDLLDLAHKGEADTVIERNGRPVAALIPFEDYEALKDELDDLRAAGAASGPRCLGEKPKPGAALGRHQSRDADATGKKVAVIGSGPAGLHVRR